MLKTKTTHLLDLESIASWRVPGLTNHTSVTATIPALQRGLVWRPQQIELLWDSIFRGFPIGSLVACRHIKNQERQANETSTHHLLDGQQRSQAISLGFDLPDFSDPEHDLHPDILWLDIAPHQIPTNSTRQFLFRLTKRSHPWGYKADDTCNRLTAHEIRTALQSTSCGENSYQRPTAAQLFPYVSNAPVPVGILMRCAGSSDMTTFCQQLRQELENIPLDQKDSWMNKALELLNHSDWKNQHLHTIWNGLQRSKNAHLNLLEVPDELLGEADELSEDNMSNIEHLFQRLNTQGTALTAEELVYSMIKAYYPQVATTIELISPLRMQPSRLVNIAVRAALTSPQNENLHNGYTVARLRAIALSDSGEFAQIADYLSPEGNLIADLNLLDEILIYRKEENPAGLPAPVISAIARSKPELFLLLLTWTRNQKEALVKVRSYLPGLVSLLSCFGLKKPETTIYQCTRNHLSLETLQQGITKATEGFQMAVLQSPDSLRSVLPDFISMKNDKDFLEWSPWKHLIEKDTEEETQKATAQWWNFSQKLLEGNLRRHREIQELLLYAQRDFLEHRFPSYDQANSQLWEDHNRPWDYDHILADEVSYNRRHSGAPYKTVVDRWVNTLGNFWACPFEDNRSFGNQPLDEKSAKGDKDFLTNAFIDNSEFDGFNSHYESVKCPKASRKLAEATKSRMLRIYSEWYDKLLIADLIQKTSQTLENDEQ